MYLMSPDASAGNRRLLSPIPGDASLPTPKNSVLAVLPALGPSGVLAPAGAACSKRRCDAKTIELLGGMEFTSFLNCVRESWRRTHARDEAFPNAIAILLSSRCLASAIKAGWGQRGCMLAAATGNLVILTE